MPAVTSLGVFVVSSRVLGGVLGLWVLACSSAAREPTGDVGADGPGAASAGGSGASLAGATSGTNSAAAGRAGAAAAGGAAEGGAQSGSGGSSVGADASAPLYDPTQFPRFDFELPAASLSALMAVQGPDDPAQDEYVSATFIYDKGGANESVANVGLRIKGEGSFLPFAQKPALKVKFDAFVSGQRFRTLARLVLNNNYDDPSFVAERLAYGVYRAAGVPAPRCNSAQVYVNGESFGVYTNLEAEDKHLLKRWFPTDGGNLYEKDGTGDFTREGAADFELETNEAANNRDDLEDLIEDIARATDPATYLQTIGGRLDTTELLTFTAVEAAVNQWDAYSFTIWWPHNFRIYDDPTSHKFFFIPWGHDLSMKPAPFTGKRFVEAFALAHDTDDASRPVTSGILFQRCLTSPGCKAAYKAALVEVTDTYEGLQLEAEAGRYYRQIEQQVRADERKRVPDGPLSNEAFDAAYQGVLDVVGGRVAALRAELAAN